ncbi:hypothetical protein K883_05295 [Mycobacterium sp. TKK-01-0059]|nr:hypothetical protein K883_05295 [Mycobacterium sp. TKK-01-0059]
MRTAPQRRVSVEHTIAAAPEVIFAVLTDPAQHAAIDGSRTLVECGADNASGPSTLKLGSTFFTTMRRRPASLHMTDLVQATIATAQRGQMRNVVVEFVENERIAWQNFGHHIWRYELQPVSNSEEDRTLVRETFDYATNICPPLLEIAGFPKRNAASMRATLHNLESHCERL